MDTPKRDVFLCHASEDKDSIVRPLYKAFTDVAISCWYDGAEIGWGDSITQKVNEGLRISRFAVAILSKASAHKHWPQRELYALMDQEAAFHDPTYAAVKPGRTKLRLGEEHMRTNMDASVPELILVWALNT